MCAEDWGFAFELDEGEIAVTMNGTEEGTWSADDDTIDVTIASSETEVTASLTAGGVTHRSSDKPDRTA